MKTAISQKEWELNWIDSPIAEPSLCQWIEGEPTIDDDCKCNAPAVSGKPYCQIHCELAYLKAGEEN